MFLGFKDMYCYSFGCIFTFTLVLFFTDIIYYKFLNCRKIYFSKTCGDYYFRNSSFTIYPFPILVWQVFWPLCHPFVWILLYELFSNQYLWSSRTMVRHPLLPFTNSSTLVFSFISIVYYVLLVFKCFNSQPVFAPTN